MLRLPVRTTLAIAVAGIGLIPLHELAADDDPAVAQGRALYMEFQCWQCHGSLIKFLRDDGGNVLRAGKENKPVIDPNTWPNSGMGRLNPDGSAGS